MAHVLSSTTLLNSTTLRIDSQGCIELCRSCFGSARQEKNMVTRRSVSGIVVLVLVLSISAVLKAQDVASITGVVTDQTGAVIQGVDVTLQNPQTGVTYKAVTNASGSYTLTQIKPGPG